MEATIIRVSKTLYERKRKINESLLSILLHTTYINIFMPLRFLHFLRNAYVCGFYFHDFHYNSIGIIFCNHSFLRYLQI